MRKIVSVFHSCLILTTALLIPAYLAAQQTSNSTPTSTAPPVASNQQHLVKLYVVVTDAKGAPVLGLTKSDFTVLEDNQTQNVVDFQIPPTSTDASKKSAIEAPRAILLLDELNTSFDSISFARNYLHKFFKQNGGKLEQPTLFVALTGNGLVMLHDYTSDGMALDQALHQHKTLVDYQLRNNGGIGRVDRLNLALAALQQITASTKDIPTDKALVWIAPGFSTIGQMNLDHNMQVGIYGLVQNISDQLFRSHITIYSVDPRGASAVRAYGNVWFQHFSDMATGVNAATLANLDLRSLVMQTGGKVFYGKDDIDHELEQAFQLGNAFYTLQYSSPNTGSGGSLRTIQVKVDRPGVTAHTREGYYALPGPPPPTPQDVPIQLKQALSSQIPYLGLSIISTQAQLVSPSNRAAIKLSLDSGDVAWQLQQNKILTCHLDIATVDFSNDGKVLHAVSRQLIINSQVGQGARIHGHLLPVSTDIPVTLPGGYVRVVVRDEATGKIGTVEVHDLEKLATLQSTDPALKQR